MRIELWLMDTAGGKQLVHTYTEEDFLKVDLLDLMRQGYVIGARYV